MGDYAISEAVVGIQPGQVDKGGVLTRDKGRNAVVEEMLKPRSPAVAPEVFEGCDYAGGCECTALGAIFAAGLNPTGHSVSPASR